MLTTCSHSRFVSGRDDLQLPEIIRSSSDQHVAAMTSQQLEVPAVTFCDINSVKNDCHCSDENMETNRCQCKRPQKAARDDDRESEPSKLRHNAWDHWVLPVATYTLQHQPNKTGMSSSHQDTLSCTTHGPLARYAKLWVAHAPDNAGNVSPPLRVSDLDMHQGTCVTHVPWCMPGSLTSGFLWSRWRGKHSRRMRNTQLYVSG